MSHSAALAGGVVELARQMAGADVVIEAAGGMADPVGAIGTDVELIRAAIERASGPDGVLVLMDLGSAVMSAEMAVELLATEGGPHVVLSEGPLVEGAIAAAARAGAGERLEEVAAEARSALTMKAAQLRVETVPETSDPAPPMAAGAGELQVEITNALGLHARPAARVVAIAGAAGGAVTVENETTGSGPVDAGSLTALVTLSARQGHTLRIRADGPRAEAVLAELRELAGAGAGFGDDDEARPVSAPRDSPGRPSHGSESPPAPGTRLSGVPVSAGIAIGPARPADSAGETSHDHPVVPDVPAEEPSAEVARLEEALVAARGDVEAARDQLAATVGRDAAAVLGAHLLLLGDAALLDPARAAIAEGRGAARAWSDAIAAVAATYRELADPYLRERAEDVEDVGRRVLRHLTGAQQPTGPVDAGILVVGELSPGDAAVLDPDLVLGVAVAHGGATSHGAILARALGIPSVAGLGEGVLGVPAGTPLVLDGEAGTLEVDPDPERLAGLEDRREAARARARSARMRAREPATTRDGATVAVSANAGSAADARAAVELGADGIGLLRTEFLFLDRETAPTEGEQQAVYEQVATALEGRPLIIRTLDAGADKPLPFLAQSAEDNPFLGLRGIRLGLAHPELLLGQLRAIVATAAAHSVRVMFPMVATLAELRAARALLDTAQADAPRLPVGVMVEVPAVALAAERFAQEVDFFSIGTNDLTQYTMAAERGNPAVADLLTGALPPVLGLVAAVVEGAAAHGRHVAVCGELAGDPTAAVLLAGLGVDELSMAAPRIPEVKATLREVDLEHARRVALEALEVEDAGAVAALVAPLLGD